MIKSVHCKKCGEGGLVWKRSYNDWLLVSVNGIRHICIISDLSISRMQLKKQQNLQICKHGTPLRHHCSDCWEEKKLQNY